jgi:glycosyltransferase involved in cell wall biosynthesis
MNGAQRTLLTLLTEIDRNVFSPMLVVPYDGPLNRAAAAHGVPIFVERLVSWIPGWSLSSRRQRLRHTYRFFRTLPSRCLAIERLIEKNEVAAVYTNTVTCVEGAIAARRTRRPHVWHIHEPIFGNGELAPLFPYRLYRSAIDRMSKSIVFPSRSVAMDYTELSDKATVVYNGLPFPAARDRSSVRAEVDNRLSLETGLKLVAVVGALHPRKDHTNFLEAAAHVCGRDKDVIFLVIGEGPESYTEYLRRKIGELGIDTRVRLAGWWPGDIYNLLAGIDVLVISSEQESFGLTAIEAMSMETPVVATRCGGPEEIVRDGDTGFLVPMKDSRSMADAILKLLADPKLGRRLGENGRKHVTERFGVGRYVHGIQRIIREAAAGQRPETAIVGEM